MEVCGGGGGGGGEGVHGGCGEQLGDSTGPAGARAAETSPLGFAGLEK